MAGEKYLYAKIFGRSLAIQKNFTSKEERKNIMKKLPDNEKRKRVNVLLSDEEKIILKEKMKKYGYTDMSVYLRDVGIYEKVYVEDINGKFEITKLMADYLSLAEKTYNVGKEMMMKAAFTNEDKNKWQIIFENHIEQIKKLQNVVEETLWISTRLVSDDPERFMIKEKLMYDNELEREETEDANNEENRNS